MLDGKGKFGDLHIVCIRLALRITKNNSVEIVSIKCKNKLNRKMFSRQSAGWNSNISGSDLVKISA